MSRDVDHAHLGKVCHHEISTSLASPCTKFDDFILSTPEKFKGCKIMKWIT